jgi:uncharacterized protein involved in tellurium resistance
MCVAKENHENERNLCRFKRVTRVSQKFAVSKVEKFINPFDR